MPKFTPDAAADENGRTWTETAGEYLRDDNDRERVAAGIASLYWREPVDGAITGPMSPVMALQAFLEAIRFPGLTRFAYNGGDASVLTYPDGPETATYGLLGAEFTFENGTLRVYLLDIGIGVVPLANDFLPSGQAFPAGEQPPGARGTVEGRRLGRPVITVDEHGQPIRAQRSE